MSRHGKYQRQFLPGHGAVVISVILYTSGTETLSVGVYYLSNFENEPLTAALSMVQTVMLLVCIIVFRRLAGREALTA